MDSGVDNVLVTHRGELLTEVSRVLVLDVLDDRLPAAVVVDEVAEAWRVDNVQTQSDAILLDDVGDGLDFSGRAGLLLWLKATL